MNYKIRPAQPADMEEIITLCAEHAEYEKANYDPVGKLEKLSALLFGKNPPLYCWVAETNDYIVGYATFSYEYSTWYAHYYTHLDCLFLRPPYRGYGIGSSMVNEIISQSKLKNAHHIEWQTPVFNKRAIEFYQKIGATSKEKLRFTLTF
jgi:ribosomal protein S18 acetylase RimI-like enzyme